VDFYAQSIPIPNSMDVMGSVSWISIVLNLSRNIFDHTHLSSRDLATSSSSTHEANDQISSPNYEFRSQNSLNKLRSNCAATTVLSIVLAPISRYGQGAVETLHHYEFRFRNNWNQLRCIVLTPPQSSLLKWHKLYYGHSFISSMNSSMICGHELLYSMHIICEIEN